MTTRGGCNWTASSNDPWIVVTSGSSGTGSGTVNYSVSSNSGGSRIGTMTVAGQTFTVTQESGQYSLDVSISPPGGGTVTGTGVDCPGDCSETYIAGSNVTLTAYPNAGYAFSNWTGCDSPSADTCLMTMDNPENVTAVFVACPGPVTVEGTAAFYASIQEAYDAALDGQTVIIHAAAFTGDINVGSNKTVTLRGGYSCDFASQTGYTAVNGSITVSGGTVSLDRMIFQ